MENLTIYKASAGSGKTFTLTQEFLLLLFQNPKKYSSVLAVTFTNKATAEMKNRIIKELGDLASTKPSAYLSLILKHHPQLNETQVRQRASNILESILQDYSHFSVTTIDKFYQKVIRAFVREMGVNNNYAIELENDEVLDKAVDNLFFKLEDENSGEIIKWLTRFTKDQVLNGDNWRISEKIKQLGKELFREQFKTKEHDLLNELSDKALLNSMETSLYAAIKKYKSDFKALGNRAVKAIEEAGLGLADFKYKSTSGINFFYLLSKGVIEMYKPRFADLCTNDEAWPGTSNKSADVELLRDQSLKALAIETRNFTDQHLVVYNSLLQLRQNFYNLGILGDLEKAIKAYVNDKNLLLLSDSNELIATIINDNDAPFIYEKTGSRFEHYMIDEFQDTSKLQWGNFKPLIDNSIADGNKNLIVGDVKQSIYRFRNSDWSLLAGKIREDFRPDQIKEEVLPVNWRSSENVIAFNNAFFKASAHTLQQIYNNEFEDPGDPYVHLIEDAYESTCQGLSPHTRPTGKVKIRVFDKKNETWKEDTCEGIIETIEEAQAKGYQARDIAILVRRKQEGKELADFLMGYQKSEKAKAQVNYTVLSDEALLLGSSKAVRFIVNMLKRVYQQDHVLLDAELRLYISQNSHLSETPGEYSACFSNTSDELDQKINDLVNTIAFLPILEQIQAIELAYNLRQQSNEAVYLQSFTDIVAEFSKKNHSDSESFIQWWDQKGKTRSVPSPIGQDAIQILTIHKSKGLEFPIVIIPFFDWKFEVEHTKAPIAWVNSKDILGNGTSLMPVRSSKSLQNTLFKEAFQKEQFLSYVDNLNLAYVAFTRAIEGLYIFSYQKAGLSGGNFIQKMLDMPYDFEELAPFPHVNLPEHWDEETQTLLIGELGNAKEASKDSFSSFKLCALKTNRQDVLHLKLNAPKHFVQAEKVLLSRAEIGIVLHEVLRKMSTPKELDKLLSQTLKEGKLNKEVVEKVNPPLVRLLNDPRVKTWFLKENKVYNESAIITESGEEYRPDRVVDNGEQVSVIDYKFGQRQYKTHQKQVKQYMKLLTQMGHQNVVGFLWYVSLGKVVKVEYQQPQTGLLNL